MRIRVPRFIGQLVEKRLLAQLPHVGVTVTPPAELTLTGPTLLYFKAENCVACGEVELHVGQLAASNGLDLRVIDFRRGGLPESVYGGQLLLDREGRIGRPYRVRLFPTLIVTGADGLIRG